MGQSNSRHRKNLHLHYGWGNETDRLEEIQQRAEAKTGAKRYQHMTKIRKRIEKQLLNRHGRLKDLQKAAKKGHRSIIISRTMFSRNLLREWVAPDQWEMLDMIAEHLTPKLRQLYGEEFHFHIVGDPPGWENPIDWDLELCWERDNENCNNGNRLYFSSDDDVDVV